MKRMKKEKRRGMLEVIWEKLRVLVRGRLEQAKRVVKESERWLRSSLGEVDMMCSKSRRRGPSHLVIAQWVCPG